MEWVETTAKTVDQAKELALDQLGVAGDEAEFDIVEEPKAGLFGRVRGEARVRARVRPTAVRPKQDRRGRGRGKGNGADRDKGTKSKGESSNGSESGSRAKSSKQESKPRQQSKPASQTSAQTKEKNVDQESTVTPQQVGDAAVSFMSGLADSFGSESTTEIEIDETNIEVRVSGDELGLMIGPGGRTLAAIQDLARVASQRRLGDHDTRLRIDVAGYREKRKVALVSFTAVVAKQVIEAGTAKALEPMLSADRKVVHDAVTELDGVTSRSEGDDPTRRVIVSPE